MCNVYLDIYANNKNPVGIAIILMPTNQEKNVFAIARVEYDG